MGILLVSLARRVPHLRPPPGVVGLGFRAADIVHAADNFVQFLGDAVEVFERVDHPDRPAFLAGAVVRHQHDHGVVTLADLLKKFHQPADLRIGVFKEAGIGFLQARRQFLLHRRQLVPGFNPGIARGEIGVGRDDAELLLSLEPNLAHHIPPGVELAAILGQIVRRRLVRRVGGAEAEIQEERLVRQRGLAVADHRLGLVHQIFR